MFKTFAKTLLKIACDRLQQEGELPPFVVAFKTGEEPRFRPLDVRDYETKCVERAKVKAFILAKQPDAVFIVMDTWVKSTENTPENRAGRKSIENDPERTEAITLTGGSTTGVFCIVQHYHREGKCIVFDALVETDDMESEFFGTAWQTLASREERTVH